ncbi:amino acid aminotransferase [Salinisphaera hydrothermalis]|uniref:amino acid aminotransferase n=1 Tax=Salinisphaera hydrothermalis TaxID=563188 RepID=UPI003340C238
MFESIERVPGDAILGLIQQFKDDPNPNKVDLGVGVYRDEHGNTPILRAVKDAEKKLIDTEQTKAYIGSHGDPQYGEYILQTVLGADSKVLAANRASATQSPGGTGALRLAADFLVSQLPGKAIWLPNPTWPNHLGVFEAARLEIKRYPYVDDNDQFDFDAMLKKLKSIPKGDIVLLHACCHNPTGFDPSQDQWHQILEVVQNRELLPLVDFAYQGFGDGLDEDAYGVRLLADNLDEMVITQSCSKNFGIYRERTGCFIAIAKDEEDMQDVRSQLATTARENYSNPPAHGSAIVATIMGSAELTAAWHRELDEMRDRINDVRQKLVEGLKPHGLADKFAFITDQRGMFSYTGLTEDQVNKLRDEYSIYMVASGRANVAGLNDDNIEYVCKAIADVVGSSK